MVLSTLQQADEAFNDRTHACWEVPALCLLRLPALCRGRVL